MFPVLATSVPPQLNKPSVKMSCWHSAIKWFRREASASQESTEVEIASATPKQVSFPCSGVVVMLLVTDVVGVDVDDVV
jgi:hypothetical protein